MKFRDWPTWMQVWIALALVAVLLWIGVFVLVGLEQTLDPSTH